MKFLYPVVLFMCYLCVRLLRFRHHITMYTCISNWLHESIVFGCMFKGSHVEMVERRINNCSEREKIISFKIIFVFEGFTQETITVLIKLCTCTS